MRSVSIVSSVQLLRWLIATALLAPLFLSGALVQAQQPESAVAPASAANVEQGDRRAESTETLPEKARATAPELPELLTLADALLLTNPAHPDLLKVQAEQAMAQAGVAASEAGSGWKANLLLQGRLADRAIETGDSDDYLDDSRAELSVSKLLYDFGASGAASEAANALAEGSALNADYQARLRRVALIARYLDVVATDYQYAADNEAMTLAFFPWNRAQERMERFQSESEVTVLELQAAYLKKLAVRNQTLRKQRKSRFQLAAALGWPDAKPSQVIEPDLSVYVRPVPDYDELVADVLKASPVLAQKKLALVAAESRLEGASGTIRPRLSLGLYASKYEQPRGSTDDHRAMLTLDVPLLDGGGRQSAQAGAQAAVYAQQAAVAAYEFALREQVMDWVQRLEALEAAIADNEVQMQFRERALDKARLLYEMEVRAQIGRAQGEMAQAIYEGARARFERAVIWEQIDAVLGRPPVGIQ